MYNITHRKWAGAPKLPEEGEAAMKNRITVTIADHEYTLVAEEDESYIRRVAQFVDQQIEQVQAGSRLSLADSAILACANIADLYYKEQSAGENLRRQVKEGVEEATKLKLELSEAKREIFKLQQNRK